MNYLSNRLIPKIFLNDEILSEARFQRSLRRSDDFSKSRKNSHACASVNRSLAEENNCLLILF